MIPHELTILPQWVGHDLIRKPDGKLNKPPYGPDGKPASHSDPRTWGTYDQALALVDSGKAKVPGFAFTEACGLAGVDFDNCRDPETGHIEPWVMAQIRAFDTYAEISASGRGVKLICRGRAPHNGKNGTKGRHPGQVEVYDRTRFFALTDNVLPGYDTIRDCQQQLEDLHLLEWPREEPRGMDAAGAVSLSLADDDIFQKARNAKNGPAFMRLYGGDTSAYNGDDSAADLGLLSMLAFYTQERDQLDRLYRSSGLMRPKWERADYRERTFNRVLSTIRETYNPGRTQTPMPVVPTIDNVVDEVAELRAQLAAKDARIAYLEDIVDTQRAVIVDRDERIQAYESDIGGYTDVLIEVAKLIDERRARGMVEPDGSVHVPYGLVAVRRTGQDAPRDVRDAVKSRVSKAVSKAAERGLLQRHTVTQLSNVDEDTGEILGVPKRTRMTYIQWGPDYRTMRVSLAKCKRPEDAPKRGGDTVRCADHPEAKVITTRIDRCAVCRKILRATRGNDEVTPEPRTEPDKANLLDIPSTPTVGKVDKANLLLQDSGDISAPIPCNSVFGECAETAYCGKRGRCRWRTGTVPTALSNPNHPENAP